MMSVHLFTLHSDVKYKKYVKRLGEIVALILCMIVMGKFLEYLLVEDDGFTQAVMKDFYGMEENIDNLYLGSSHVHYDIKPAILDEITGENNFSLSTGLQPMNASYYLLKEADQNHELSHVYLELSCGLTTGEYGEIKNYEQLPNNWRVLNYVKPSVNKLQWMLDISDPKYYYLSFIPARRYYKELLDGVYIGNTVQNKLADYETKWKGGYVYKGYREDFTVAEGMYCKAENRVTLGEKPLSEDVEEYLLKIIEYCEKNQIRLTLFTSPIMDCELQNIEDYDNWRTQIKQLADEHSINYFDFNLCKTEYLDLNDVQYWRDNNHLNTWGADVYTQFLGEVFEEEKNGENDPYRYFYESYALKE